MNSFEEIADRKIGRYLGENTEHYIGLLSEASGQLSARLSPLGRMTEDLSCLAYGIIQELEYEADFSLRRARMNALRGRMSESVISDMARYTAFVDFIGDYRGNGNDEAAEPSLKIQDPLLSE